MTSSKKQVGRPKKLQKDAMAEAERILQVGCALSMNRTSKLKEIGFESKQEALAFVSKRRRGITGAALGNAIQQSHFPAINRTATALRCIAEDGMPVAVVARYFGLDRRNLLKALPRFRKKLAEEVAAIGRVVVSDAN